MYRCYDLPSLSMYRPVYLSVSLSLSICFFPPKTPLQGSESPLVLAGDHAFGIRNHMKPKIIGGKWLIVRHPAINIWLKCCNYPQIHAVGGLNEHCDKCQFSQVELEVKLRQIKSHIAKTTPSKQTKIMTPVTITSFIYTWVPGIKVSGSKVWKGFWKPGLWEPKFWGHLAICTQTGFKSAVWSSSSGR